jgi:hypothetical protein
VKCRQIVEVDFYFDTSDQRRLTNTSIKDGAIVDKAVYDAWVASQASD